MERGMLILLAVFIIALAITAFFYPASQVLTIERVLEEADDFLGKVITLRGTADSSTKMRCTLVVCPPENPCCNTCSADLMLLEAGSRIRLSGIYKGREIECWIPENSCEMECWPLEKGDEYRVTGTLREANRVFYLELEGFEAL